MRDVIPILGLVVIGAILVRFFRAFWRPVPRGETAERTHGDWGAASVGWTRDGESHGNTGSGSDTGT